MTGAVKGRRGIRLRFRNLKKKENVPGRASPPCELRHGGAGPASS